MAYIRKLPSGNFNAIVRLPNGKRLSKTDPRKGVVKAWADKTELAVRAGGVARDERLTYGEWHRRWWAMRSVEATTAKTNESHIRKRLLPHWQTYPLASIRRSDVQMWVNDMVRDGVGAPTVVATYHLLSAALSEAVLEGILPASPCQRITLPRVLPPEPRWLTREEYDRLQLALAMTPRAQVWQPYVALGCYSGLRPGELNGLDVAAVDLERNLVWVSQVMTRAGLRDYPKTSGSRRWVSFPPHVGEMLWPLIADKRPTDPVFTSPRGMRVNEWNWRKTVWIPSLRAAGIEYVRPYVMRHTMASWLIQAGMSKEKIAKLLGHSTTGLVDRYGHLGPEVHDDVQAVWQRWQPSQHTNDPRPVTHEQETTHNRW